MEKGTQGLERGERECGETRERRGEVEQKQGDVRRDKGTMNSALRAHHATIRQRESSWKVAVSVLAVLS